MIFGNKKEPDLNKEYRNAIFTVLAFLGMCIVLAILYRIIS